MHKIDKFFLVAVLGIIILVLGLINIDDFLKISNHFHMVLLGVMVSYCVIASVIIFIMWRE